jgi:hypothetical protein
VPLAAALGMVGMVVVTQRSGEDRAAVLEGGD